jgi:protein-tyrosine phosphatase
MNKPKLKILFVCMGNICRSPTAEGVFRQKLVDHHLTDEVVIDSAGTHNYHPNSPPDGRSLAHAMRRGYNLTNLRARAVTDHDFEDFDLLLTMDWDNRALLEERCPEHLQHKIKGFAEFLTVSHASVIPDPYYGGDQGFEQVLDLIEEASDGLLKLVIKQMNNH